MSYPQQPYMPQPQIVINNSASAMAMADGGRGFRKRQSVGVHCCLFVLIAGIGNVVYAWYVMDWNKKHGF